MRKGRIMRKMLIVAVVAFSVAWLAAVSPAMAGHRFGGGANYWKSLNDIDVNDIDKNGFSYLASYQYVPAGIFKLEVDLEYYPKLGEDREAFWSPEAFLLLGGTLYAGVGIGDYFDGKIFNNKPFFMLRAGVDIALLPFLFLDVNANYRFNDWGDVADDVDTNTIRLGAALRVAL